jgi:pimeloyl-ACP methyl ester carboxylesterase
MQIEQWWEQGETVPVQAGTASWEIFVRRMGAGPSMTLLHGFPSSSHDWAKVALRLAEHHALLMPDLLGMGASERPVDHEYSLHEQADLVEALWRIDGVETTTLVAHDYSASVAQELLARRADGALAVELEHVFLLNGGVYPDLHRPEPVQTALLDPEQGPKVNAMLTEELFATAVAPTFAEHFDARADVQDIWKSASRGPLVWHRLIHYMTDRRTHEARWVGALETTDVPLTFVWGLLDPISGAHMLARIRERIPHATVVALEDVGHWPSLEAPDRLLDAVLAGA